MGKMFSSFSLCHYIIIKLSKLPPSLKPFHIAGDFNLNILDHDKCSRVDKFFNFLCENGMIPTINKATKITRKIATVIDHILTNQFINVNFKNAISKTIYQTIYEYTL